ncbi:lipopolysaccharide biosynthesis protein [Vagococcus fluvialis]|uniref:lipopolysaccharide biosynthesis protein n=1 Tax=Vagococcus fluvialis TaxID=2738 RepID=UPI002B31D1F3|nr:hypothetical protein QDW48_03780 [Vagococcus fluvialis]
MENKKNKIIGDMFLNLVSSLLLTSVLQLAVYPILSHNNLVSDFGNILTITGICNAIGIMFGVSLNNLLLLKNNEFEREVIKSTFLKLTITSTILCLLISQISMLPFISFLKTNNYLIMTIYILLLMFRSFLTVFYRINLNYKLIVKHTIITSLGYLIGLFLYKILNIWGLIFFTGELFSLLFLLMTVPIKINKNDFYLPININIRNDFVNFFIASAIANLMLYLDRLLINPILGASQVAVFFAASVIGKLLSLVMQPFSSVMLSYLSKEKVEDGYKIFKKSIFIASVSGAVFFCISFYLTPYLLNILYRDLYQDAMTIYVLCNVLAIINNMSVILQPLTLKFCPTSWQRSIQIIYCISYFCLSIILMRYFGLVGFIIGNILSSIIKLFMIIILMIKYTKNIKEL